MYIGLTGYMGCGKGVISDILKSRGYKYISLSNAIRAEATSRNVTHTRENLQAIGNELRSQFGGGIFGRKIRNTLEQDAYDQWVIDGIRNPAEIEELRKLPDFHLIGCHADEELLISRILIPNLAA